MNRQSIVQPSSRKDERGYVAVLVVLLASSVLFGCAALGVDVARWWVEVQRVQKAADAGALGGVSYLPQDYSSAVSTATAVSARNGYPNSGETTVTVAHGEKPSQLKVTVCSVVHNSFGGVIGIQTTRVCRSAVADFTGPAPMGSPCNTFGNEPNSGGGSNSPAPSGSAQGSSPFTNCLRRPQIWATVEGPQTDKIQGDRYQTKSCANGTGTDGCTSGNTNNNAEYNEAGYFWLVRVQPAAVNKPINLQLFDPAFVLTNNDCSALPAASGWATNTPNSYVNDAKTRYSTNSINVPSGGAPFCPGDYFPGGGSTGMTTSFALRQQTDTLNPLAAPLQNDNAGKACIKQFKPYSVKPVAGDLTDGKVGGKASVFDNQLAQTFHNWYSLCTFTPTRAGDYYLQVRTNVAAGGSSAANTTGNPTLIYNGVPADVLSNTGNTTSGYGDNSFAIRAVTAAGYETDVSVSGFDRMPIYANADSANSQFNLIRVPSAAQGKSITFSFFDVGDASSSGTVRVALPSEATYTGTQFPNGGCKAVGGNAGTGASLSNCSAPITNSKNNGKTETMSIPIPNDYRCNDTSLGGCWYQVYVTFSSGNVSDITTWTASVTGDPVRLIE